MPKNQTKRTKPQSGESWFTLGKEFANQGKLDEAIKAYRNALKDRKIEAPEKVWNNLGNALLNKGERDEAIKAYRKALKNPKFETPGIVWCNLGIALREKSELAEAIKAFRKALKDPNFETPGMAWNNLGIAFHNNGKLAEAIKAFRKALKDRKVEAPGKVLNNLGNALLHKGERDEAIKAYREALKDPQIESPGIAWYNLGNTLREKGELDEAIKAYHKALKDPKYATPGMAWNNLGIVLRKKGELGEAIKAFGKALKDPKYETPGKAWNNLGIVLREKGELGEAIKAFGKALKDPKYETPGKAWNNLAEAYFESNQPERARKAYEKALKTRDQSEMARARLGLQRLQSKLKEEALSPDDRAIVSGGTMATPTADGPGEVDNLEDEIIAAIKEAGDTQYGKYIAGPDSGRDDTLSVLRGWSSAVTLLEGPERHWRGGGYFLKWRGFGIVIDPGFDFLRNFHDAGYHGREINAVLISHNHPDHNSDLKDIDDLRYEVFKRSGAPGKAAARAYTLVCDQDTEASTKFNITKPQHRYATIVFADGFPQPIDLRTAPWSIPVRVIPFKVNHGEDVPRAMGMVLELLNEKGGTALRIGYTGDTAYFEDLSKHLSSCDVLIAHPSQPSIEELQDPKKLKEIHLGYRGTARLLNETQPKLALIGEFWAGFADLRIALVKGLRQRSGVEAVFPAGLALHLKLPSLEIQCTECGKSLPFLKVKVAPPTDEFGSLAYLCPKCLLQ
jgi:Tfp pilus assembly protein PilF/ribonuclease BN (tRNA processing enzyme)